MQNNIALKDVEQLHFESGREEAHQHISRLANYVNDQQRLLARIPLQVHLRTYLQYHWQYQYHWLLALCALIHQPGNYVTNQPI